MNENQKNEFVTRALAAHDQMLQLARETDLLCQQIAGGNKGPTYITALVGYLTLLMEQNENLAMTDRLGGIELLKLHLVKRQEAAMAAGTAKLIGPE